jgi:hypothetical protein
MAVLSGLDKFARLCGEDRETRIVDSDVTGRSEITPEMIAAGVREFLSYDGRFEDYEDVVIRIWNAMNTARISAT